MEIPDQDFQKFLIVNVQCLFKDKIEKQLMIDVAYLTYDKFIRKILRNVHIPVINQPNSIMKIEHMGIPITINNDYDLQFIIRSILLNNESINVTLTFTQNTYQIKQKIVFNEEGEKMNEEFGLNEPSDPRYVKPKKNVKQISIEKVNRSYSAVQTSKIEEDDDEDEVFCAFCKESVNNLEYIKKLGWFYGPYKHKKNTYYVHLMCAIWSPAVYLDEKTNKMINIKKEIIRSNKCLCKYCGSFGGGLGCKVNDCKQTFHFKCALSDDIDVRLDHIKFELYCPNHGHILDQKIQDELEKVHCEECQVDENEELILLCDNCDKAFHTYCLQNKLSSVPEGDWFCPECLEKNPRLNIHHPPPPQLPISIQTQEVQNEIQQVNSQLKKGLSQNSQKINSHINEVLKEDSLEDQFLVNDLQNFKSQKNQQLILNKTDIQINENISENLWDLPQSPIEKKRQIPLYLVLLAEVIWAAMRLIMGVDQQNELQTLLVCSGFMLIFRFTPSRFQKYLLLIGQVYSTYNVQTYLLEYNSNSSKDISTFQINFQNGMSISVSDLKLSSSMLIGKSNIKKLETLKDILLIQHAHVYEDMVKKKEEEKKKQKKEKKLNQQEDESLHLLNGDLKVSWTDQESKKKYKFNVKIVPIYINEPLLFVFLEDITIYSKFTNLKVNKDNEFLLQQSTISFLSDKLQEIMVAAQISVKQMQRQLISINQALNFLKRQELSQIYTEEFSLSTIINQVMKLYEDFPQIKYINQLVNDQIKSYRQILFSVILAIFSSIKNPKEIMQVITKPSQNKFSTAIKLEIIIGNIGKNVIQYKQQLNFYNSLNYSLFFEAYNNYIKNLMQKICLNNYYSIETDLENDTITLSIEILQDLQVLNNQNLVENKDLKLTQSPYINYTESNNNMITNQSFMLASQLQTLRTENISLPLAKAIYNFPNTKITNF